MAGDQDSLKRALLDKAQGLGFSICGIAPVMPEPRRDYFLQWIASGKHGDMKWLERNQDRRLNPSLILPAAQSIICVGLNYYQPQPEQPGRMAKYALGKDYHKIMERKLKQLCRWLREQGGDNKPYVDTGPVLERSVANRAGIGWQGKSTMLIHPKLGTWFFLGEIITSLKIPPDQPMKDFCGKCTACIDACPTRAIIAPYQLDARKCISYLTIEHKGSIPLKYRQVIGDRLFGCDDCLTACPWNRWAVHSSEQKFQARPLPELRSMLLWTEQEFEDFFRGTAVKRLGLSRWLRNVCIVIGNTGTTSDLPALEKAVNPIDPLVAEHAAWAANQISARHCAYSDSR